MNYNDNAIRTTITKLLAWISMVEGDKAKETVKFTTFEKHVHNGYFVSLAYKSSISMYKFKRSANRNKVLNELSELGYKVTTQTR